MQQHYLRRFVFRVQFFQGPASLCVFVSINESSQDVVSKLILRGDDQVVVQVEFYSCSEALVLFFQHCHEGEMLGDRQGEPVFAQLCHLGNGAA